MSSLMKQITTTVILAIAGFILVRVLEDNAYSGIIFSLGVLIGAFAIIGLNRNSADMVDITGDNHDAALPANTEIQTLYVGNLPYKANERMVREHFSQHGKIKSVRLMKDKRTGKRKGYGFAEVAATDAERLIETLNDSEFHERNIKVRIAKERKNEELVEA